MSPSKVEPGLSSLLQGTHGECNVKPGLRIFTLETGLVFRWLPVTEKDNLELEKEP